MEQKKDKPWKIMWWEAQHWNYGSSDECRHRLDDDKSICYDPISYITHPCTKELCPLYHNYREYYREDGSRKK